MTRSGVWALAWNLLRLAVAAAVVAAVAAQLAASLARAAANGDDVPTILANFFSFFTILSNLLAAVVLLIAAAWYLTRGRRDDTLVEPLGLSVALASVSTYMVITGIVYNALLRGIALPQGSQPIPWSNETLHLIAPIFLLLDVLVAPRRRRMAWGTVWIVVVLPIVWVVYTLVRGPLVTNPVSGDPSWYPYPFLNPANFANGYGTVLLYIVGIAIAIIAVAFFVVWVARRRGGEGGRGGGPRPRAVAG